MRTGKLPREGAELLTFGYFTVHTSPSIVPSSSAAPSAGIRVALILCMDSLFPGNPKPLSAQWSRFTVGLPNVASLQAASYPRPARN